MLGAFLTPVAKKLQKKWPNCINKQNKDLFFTAKGFVAFFLFVLKTFIHQSVVLQYIIYVRNWWCQLVSFSESFADWHHCQLQFEEVGSWFFCLNWPFVIILKVKVIFSIIILQKVHQNWHNCCCCFFISRVNSILNSQI